MLMVAVTVKVSVSVLVPSLAFIWWVPPELEGILKLVLLKAPVVSVVTTAGVVVTGTSSK
jgi:hypothetical protein